MKFNFVKYLNEGKEIVVSTIFSGIFIYSENTGDLKTQYEAFSKNIT